VTERPEGWSPTDIPGDIVRNAKELFQGLPQLPGALVHQVQDLPNIGQRLDEAIADPSKRGNVPLLAMVPGATTAWSAAVGDWEAIAKNPLFTALDVLPYAKAKVFKAPASWVDEAGNVARPRSLYQDLFPETRYTAREARRMQGITGEGPLGLGQAQVGKADIMDVLGDTKPGRVLKRERDILRIRARGTAAGNEVQAGLGKEIRSLMQARDQISRGIFDVMNDSNSPIWKTLMGERFQTFRPAVQAQQRLMADFGEEFAKANYGTQEAWAARRSELGQIVERTPEEIPTLPAHEQAYIDSAQQVNDLLIEPLTSSDPTRPAMFGKVEVPLPDGTTHMLTTDWKSAQKIWTQQTRAAMHEDTLWLRDAVDNPGALTADDILAHAEQSAALHSPTIPVAAKINVIEGYAHALTAIGEDARPFLADIRKAKYGQVPGEALSWLKDTETLPGRIPIAIDEIADSLKFVDSRGVNRYMAGRHMAAPEMNELKGMMRAFERDQYTPNQLTVFRTRLNDIHARAQAGRIDAPDAFKALDIDKANATIDILRRRENWKRGSQTKQWLDDKFTTAQVKYRKAVSRTPDQRLVPMLQEQAHARMVETAEEITAKFNAATPDAIGPELVDLVTDRQYRALKPYLENQSVKQLWKGYVAEANNSWQQLAADLGPDNMPRFVHHVPAERAEGSQFINISLGGKKPGAWKKRSVDLTPYSRDISLAANANVIDHLVKQGDDYLLDIIQHGDASQGWTPWVQKQGELLDKLQPLIERERILHPNTAYDVIAERVLKRTYTQVSIDPIKKLDINEAGLKGYSTGAKDKVVFHAADSEQIWMPRSMARAVQQMRTPMRARAVWDPVMSTFRTSALILSPRWQVYNVLGNGFLGMMSNGWEFLNQLPKARENLNLIRRMEEGATLPPNLRSSLAGRTPGELVLDEVAKEGWAKTFRLAGEKGQSAYTTWQKTKVPYGFSKIKNWSIGMNAYMDDLSRIANYLAGEKKIAKTLQNPEVAAAFERSGESLAKATGAEADEAGRAGPSRQEWTQAEAENRMLEATYNWSSMTPWERSTARNIFPFYGFYSHILRYAGKFALDHPFRVAIYAGFARAEMEDWGTGLPERLHNYFLLNRDRDEQGNILGINMAGWSPFANTADLFTISGWVNQVNPLLSTLMQQFGIDPRTGEASTYPDTAFDPATGRLALQKPNIATSLIQSVIPQTQALAALTGFGDEEQRRLAPDSYAAQIRSAIGIPSLYRRINVPQEMAYAEAAALNSRKQAEAEAYKTGGTPSNYPVLAAEVTKRRTLQELSPSAVAQFTPPSTSPPILDLVKRAIVPGG
jgi:hypothetical protein